MITRQLYVTATNAVVAASIVLPPASVLLGVHLNLCMQNTTAVTGVFWSQLALNALGSTAGINDQAGVLANLFIGTTGGGGALPYGLSEYVPLNVHFNRSAPSSIYLIASAPTGANNAALAHAVLYLK